MRRATAFVVSAGALAVLAFDGGGYDLIARQGLGLIVWAAIAVGFALGLFPRSRPTRVTLIPLGFGLALLAWMLLSLAWTGSDERTSAEIARLLTYAGLATLAFCSLNRYTFRAAAAGVSAAAIGVAAVALLTRLFPDLIPSAGDLSRAFETDRLTYPLDYWNAVGAWGAMAMAIGLAWSAHARLPLTRALALASVPVSGAAVYLTYSRAGVIATVVALIAVLALSRNRWTAAAHALPAGAGVGLVILTIRDNPAIADASGGDGGATVALILAVVAGACAGCAYLAAALDLDRLRVPAKLGRSLVAGLAALGILVPLTVASGPVSRAWDQFNEEGRPASGPDPAQRLTTAGGTRSDIWASAIDAFGAHPVDGIGPGTFEYWWSSDARNPEFVRDAHSIYLEQLAELGLPGLVLLLGGFGGLIAVALRARSRLRDASDIGASVAMCAAFAVFLVSAGVDWMWEETAVGALAVVSIAIAGAAGSDRLRRRERSGPVSRPGIRAAVVVVALAAAAFEVPGIVSTDRLSDSQAAVRAGDLPLAAQLAQSSVDAEPWAAAPRIQLGLVRERQEQLGAALRNLDDARARERGNWRIPLAIAGVQLKNGDRAAARRSFQQGRRLAPLSPYFDRFSPLALSLRSKPAPAAVQP